jgi:serine/threonine protein phosphatase PrpC
VTGPAATQRVCPHCESALHPEDTFCEECGYQVGPVTETVAPRPEAAGLGAVGRRQAQAGEEIGGVDADSVQFDAAARQLGPPRRPGVKVLDIDVESVPRTCPECSGAIAPDGYCEQCGTPAPRPRDHWVERPSDWVALACDRGVRHAVNQDGAAVGARPEPGSFAAMVVCDGVSSAARSELASLAAARAARDALVAPRRTGAPVAEGTMTAPVVAPMTIKLTIDALAARAAAACDGTGTDLAAERRPETGTGAVPDTAIPHREMPTREIPLSEISESGIPTGPMPTGGEAPVGSSAVQSKASLLAAAMREAGAAAQERAEAAASDPPEYNPPACTFAAAVIDDGVLIAGWVGDSRVYWLPDDGVPLQLSEDDSLAGEAIRHGLPREDAERSPHAHSITRWLGRDAPDPQPRTAVRRIDTPAWVLVCSDGLWNYCSEAAAMRELVRNVAGTADRDVSLICEGLVSWAIEQGGHDNISVILARVG